MVINMKQIWTSIKNRKNLWIFLGIIFIFGIGVGIYFGFSSTDGMASILSNYITSLTEMKTHFSLFHLTILSVLFISSFFFLGLPLAVCYIFYEGMSFGFCLILFVSFYHFYGLLFL